MVLEKIYKLGDDESQILHAEIIDNKSIEVRQWQQYRWLHLGDNSVQTLLQLDAVDQVLLPNIQALLTTLLFCTDAKQLLNLGLGGASPERFLNSKRSDIGIRSVESNEKIIQLAKDFFVYLPWLMLYMIRQSIFYQIIKKTTIYILCDIFVADMQASCLSDKAFYADIDKCLDKKGILAINILPESEEDVINVLLPMKNFFSHIYLLEFPDYSNVILFSTNQKSAELNELENRAEALFQQSELDLRDIPERLNVILETI